MLGVYVQNYIIVYAINLTMKLLDMCVYVCVC